MRSKAYKPESLRACGRSGLGDGGEERKDARKGEMERVGLGSRGVWCMFYGR